MNIKKMLKFLEVPDRKRGDTCTRKELSLQKKENLSFSSDWRSDNTYIFLAAGKRPTYPQ